MARLAMTIKDRVDGGPLSRAPLSEGCLTSSLQVGSGCRHTEHTTRNASPQGIVVCSADDVDAGVTCTPKEPGCQTDDVHSADTLLVRARVTSLKDGCLHHKSSSQVDLEDAPVDGAVNRSVGDCHRAWKDGGINALAFKY